MDPYLLLGVSPGCTLEELKQAYRAKVWSAHPDLGGDEPTFIEVCDAYKQVLQELAQRHAPRGSQATQTWSPSPTNSPRNGEGRSGPRPFRQGRSTRQVPRPADPLWRPDLVIEDHPIWIGHPGRPPDPDWEPELILLDKDGENVAAFPASDSSEWASGSSLSWLRRFSIHPIRRLSALSRQEMALGFVLLLAMLAIALLALFHLFRQGTGEPMP
jgi:curved DNA-binding protein CbpA